jgi:hypothetical protein
MYAKGSAIYIIHNHATILFFVSLCPLLSPLRACLVFFEVIAAYNNLILTAQRRIAERLT